MTAEPPNESPSPWPSPVSVCRDCRTTYLPGEMACDRGEGHMLLAIGDPPQREKLVDEVWGPPSMRRKVREAATAGGTSGAAGGLGECLGADCSGLDCSGCGDAASGGGEALAVIAVIVIVAIAVIALYFIIKAIVQYVRKRRALKAARPKPKGAFARPKRLGKRTGYAGTVVATHAAPDPLTDTDCVAFGLKLRTKRFLAGDIMMRHAASTGFDVQLDSGEVVRIPAGRVVIDMHGADKLATNDTNRARVDGFIAGIDPLHNAEADAAIPWDNAHVRLIRPGDRVSLRGEIERAPDPTAQHGGDYREAAASVLVPQGVPQLVLEA